LENIGRGSSSRISISFDFDQKQREQSCTPDIEVSSHEPRVKTTIKVSLVFFKVNASEYQIITRLLENNGKSLPVTNISALPALRI